MSAKRYLAPIVCCGLVLATPVAAVERPAHAAPLAPRIAATDVAEDTYPDRRIPFAHGVTGLPDLTYRTLDGYRPLKLDLYLPKRARGAAPAPLIVYVHGGSWNRGHARHSGPFASFPEALAEIAARGYAVASVNYRLSSEARFPASVQDVKAAIRWLRAHAAEYGIDRSRAAVWGASAGGQIAALVGVSCGMPEFAPGPTAALDREDCVQAAAPWFGVFDFTNPPPIPPELRERMRAGFATTSTYLGCEYPDCPAETLRLASAQKLIRPEPPPFLLVHGERDPAVSAQQSLDFGAALRTAGGTADVLVIPEVGHGFIGATPDATREANLEAINRTFEFFERTIGPGRR